MKLPRTNLKYSESQQVPTEGSQRMYRLGQQSVGKPHHATFVDIERSHPALQLHLSPVAKNQGKGVGADLHLRKTG